MAYDFQLSYSCNNNTKIRLVLKTHISFDVDKTNELALVPWSMYFRIWSKVDYSFVGKN